MIKLDKTVMFFIIGVALFQSWTAYVLPIRGDEAFLILKSTNNSWGTIPYVGLGESLISIFSYFGENVFTLRIPAIILLSLSLGLIYKMASALGGAKAGWFATITFAVIPSVSFAYTSVTPNGLFIFFAVASIYGWYRGLLEKSGKHYTAAMISSVAAFLTHASGIFFVFIPFLYLLVRRDLLEDKKFMVNALIGIILMALVIVVNLLGYIDVLHTYPVKDTDPMIKRLLLLSLSFFPSIIVIAHLFIRRNIFLKDTTFFNIMFFMTNIAALILISFMDYDMRNLGAFMVPSAILVGFIFSKSESVTKYLISAIIIGLFIYSAGTALYIKNTYVPSYIHGTRVFETLKYPIDKVLNVGKAVFSRDPLFSSIISIHVNHKPEACTIASCSSTSGVFISNKKEKNLDKYFDNVLESGTYRITSIDSGNAQFYFYDVMGIKENYSNKKFNNSNELFFNDEVLDNDSLNNDKKLENSNG